jgi:CelD/BcsL family acetyltransferase involved in cellulose biosynthesis
VLSAAAPPRPAYRVEEHAGRAAFDALGKEWDALLVRGPVDLPFARHAWLSAWLDAFAPAERAGEEPSLLVLAARDRAGAAAGLAPLLRERRRGVTWLRAPANDHSCRVEWAVGPDAVGAVAALWAHLRDRLRWDVLLLRDLPVDGPTSCLLEPLARADGHLTGRWRSLETPYLELGGEAVESRLSAKFRGNLRRRARRLAELGAVALRREDGADDVEGTLRDFLALEASGWKGAAGTAIAGDPRVLRFYQGWVREAAARRALAVRALTLDGHTVAMHLGLVHRGVYYLPKTAYDERLAAASPGQLLHREVVAECEARGLAALDFLGPDMPWKRDWEPRHRPHDWLYVYRPSPLGRALHALRHRVRPAVKEVLRWRP